MRVEYNIIIISNKYMIIILGLEVKYCIRYLIEEFMINSLIKYLKIT
jgi:hypothetical protein